MIEDNNWDHEWNSPYKVKNRFFLEKINLSYNKYGNPTSWRIFLRNFLMFTRESLEEVCIENSGLTNLQLIGIKDGFKDSIEMYLEQERRYKDEKAFLINKIEELKN